MNPCAPSIQIRRSARAKRLRLVVKPGLIELVAPLGAPESQALAFLHRHRQWAEDKVREMDDRIRHLEQPAVFMTGSTLPWQGREIPLVINEDAVARVHVCIDRAVLISVPKGLGKARADVAKQALFNWVRRWLRGQVERLAERHALRFELHPRRIRVKQMKTRWGSCGPRNDININWLLAFAPESVLEYVVVHELCHIRVRNHSLEFWSLVAQHIPDYRNERQWLRVNGADLMRRI